MDANVSPKGTSPQTVDAVAVLRQHQAWARADAPPWLHQTVAERMAERLMMFRVQPATVVQWWPDGGTSEALLKAAYPQARHHQALHPARDLSTATAAPSNQATQRAPWWRRLAVTQTAVDPATRDNAVPAASCQMLWANMALHATADAPGLMQRWHDALSVDGVLLFSTLGPGTARELQTLYAAQGWGPCGTTLTDMHDIGDELVRLGFADPVMDQETITLHWASVGAMLAELRTLGRNASPQRHAGLRTPRWRAALGLALLQQASASLDAKPGRVAMSFEVVYGHAFKPMPRAASNTVDLEQVRASLPSRRRASRPS
jgi:malonyl-CoA O-methyltransferase